MHAPSRREGLGLVLLCLAGTLVLGFASKEHCASGEWSDGRQYRTLCYSDIVPLLATEQLTGSRRPYLNACAPSAGECDEYPVLTMYVMRAAAWVIPGGGGAGPGPAPPPTTRDFSTFFSANATLIAISAFVTVIATYRVAGRRALYVALAPTLLIYGFMNWDLIAVAFATVGVVAYLRKRDVWAGVLLGLGTAAKLFPGLLLVPLVLGRLRKREPDRAIHLVWAAAGAWLAVNVPFALVSFRSWSEFYRYNSNRSADFDSLWFLGCKAITGNPYCTHTGAISLASLVLFVGASVLVWRLKTARHPDFPAWTFGFPLLVVLLLSNKVYSPQYGLWLLPWFAWTLPELRAFVAFEIADVAVFITRFGWFGRTDPDIHGWVDSMTFGLFEIAILLRAAVLVWCLVRWIRREPEPVPDELEARAAAEASA